MVKRRLNEDPIVVVAVEEEAVVEMTDDQDNHAKWVFINQLENIRMWNSNNNLQIRVVVMLVLLKLVKPKVQLIDQNDLMVNDEDVLHVVVPVAVQEVNDDSTAKVVIQNHPKRFLLQYFITK